VHLDIIGVSYSPTDAQVNCPKSNFKTRHVASYAFPVSDSFRTVQHTNVQPART